MYEAKTHHSKHSIQVHIDTNALKTSTTYTVRSPQIPTLKLLRGDPPPNFPEPRQTFTHSIQAKSNPTHHKTKMKLLLLTTTTLSLLTQTRALYLCLFQSTVEYAVGSDVYPEPACFARAVDSSSDCTASAGDGAVVGNQCDVEIDQNTSQGGGFWINSHNINYEKDGTHWYCDPGNCPSGVGIGEVCGCDAGGGAPA